MIVIELFVAVMLGVFGAPTTDCTVDIHRSTDAAASCPAPPPEESDEQSEEQPWWRRASVPARISNGF